MGWIYDKPIVTPDLTCNIIGQHCRANRFACSLNQVESYTTGKVIFSSWIMKDRSNVNIVGTCLMMIMKMNH
jgi:hypothetical protein